MKLFRNIIKKTIPIIVIYIFWWLGAFFVNRPVLPSPDKAVMQFFLILPRLWIHMVVSIYRVAGAMCIAFLLGLPLGLLLGYDRNKDKIVFPVIYILHPVPKIAFLPVIMILLGLGDASKIFTMAAVIFFLVLITARDAAKNIDKHIYDSLYAMGADPLQIYRHVVVPAVMPAVFTTLRLSTGTAIAVLFFTETFATSYGIGYFIIDAWTRVAYGEMFAGIIGLSLIGVLLYQVIDRLEKHICRWKNVQG